MNVTEKLAGYSKFWRRPCVFYGLFEWKKSAGHVLCKIVFHRTVEPSLFPGAPSNFIGKDGVRVKSHKRFFTRATVVLTGRKNKRDIFYQARTSVLIKILRFLEKFQPVNRLMHSVPSQLYSSLQRSGPSGTPDERLRMSMFDFILNNNKAHFNYPSSHLWGPRGRYLG